MPPAKWRLDWSWRLLELFLPNVHCNRQPISRRKSWKIPHHQQIALSSFSSCGRSPSNRISIDFHSKTGKKKYLVAKYVQEQLLALNGAWIFHETRAACGPTVSDRNTKDTRWGQVFGTFFAAGQSINRSSTSEPLEAIFCALGLFRNFFFSLLLPSIYFRIPPPFPLDLAQLFLIDFFCKFLLCGFLVTRRVVWWGTRENWRNRISNLLVKTRELQWWNTRATSFNIAPRWFIILSLKRRVYPISRAFFLRQWDLLRTANRGEGRRRKIFLFPECHGSPREETTRALGSPLSLHFQSRNREERERQKKQIRADAEGKISDGIHFLCHPLTEETIDLQRSISVQLSVNADDDRFFWRNNTLSHLFILISQAVESLNRSFLQEGKWRQLTQSLKLFTNRIFRLFS